jgi:protein TonB
MYANGFLEQKKRSPVSLAAVVGLHATALGAVILFGTTTFQREAEHRLIAVNITEPQIPPEIPPPPPRPDQPTTRQIDRPTITQQDIPTDSTITGPVTPPRTYQEPTTPPGPVYAEAAIPRIPDPVRIGAQVDPRFRDALQPPYPREQEAAQRTGSVRVRITIGTDGRVTAIEQLFATNDSFWRVTERQARTRWRFRPATVDGRPIVSTMLMTVTFRIPDA